MARRKNKFLLISHIGFMGLLLIAVIIFLGIYIAQPVLAHKILDGLTALVTAVKG